MEEYDILYGLKKTNIGYARPNECLKMLDVISKRGIRTSVSLQDLSVRLSL